MNSLTIRKCRLNEKFLLTNFNYREIIKTAVNTKHYIYMVVELNVY